MYEYSSGYILAYLGPSGPKFRCMRSKRVHFPTPAGVGAKKGTFEPQKGSKNEGYTRAKITDFWSPTFISILGVLLVPAAVVPAAALRLFFPSDLQRPLCELLRPVGTSLNGILSFGIRIISSSSSVMNIEAIISSGSCMRPSKQFPSS